MNKLPSSTIMTRLCWGVFFLVLLFLVIQVMPRALGQREDSKERLIDAEAEWIWQNPLPQGNTLQDFFLIDTNNGFAVGASGTISEQRTEETIGIFLQAEPTMTFTEFLLLMQITEQL